MINQLRLENFKGFKKASIEFGKITVIIGPNGVGKSGILPALMMLRQSIGQNNLVVDGNLLHMGTFNDVLYRKATKKEIGIGLSINVKGITLGGPKLVCNCVYDAYFNPAVVKCNMVISARKRKIIDMRGAWPGSVSVRPPDYIEQKQSGRLTVGFSGERTVLRPISVGSSTETGGLADELVDFTGSWRSLLLSMETVLSKCKHVPAIRGLDKPAYSLSNSALKDIGPGENTGLVSTFTYAGREVQEIISDLTEKITGSKISSKLSSGPLVGINSEVVTGGIPLVGDGFGVNQLVHLLLVIVQSEDGSTILIEEPEVHLHPKAQTKLGKILANISVGSEKQLVITTHSQYILFAFVNAVKAGELNLGDLAIYSIPELDNEAIRVEQDEYGDIYAWDKNFFGYE